MIDLSKPVPFNVLEGKTIERYRLIPDYGGIYFYTGNYRYGIDCNYWDCEWEDYYLYSITGDLNNLINSEVLKTQRSKAYRCKLKNFTHSEILNRKNKPVFKMGEKFLWYVYVLFTITTKKDSVVFEIGGHAEDNDYFDTLELRELVWRDNFGGIWEAQE